MPGKQLHCPIRGQLTVSEKAADALTYTEEKRRIDCIKFLLAKGYPASHFKIVTTLLRFGHKGKNSFRTDVAILDAPVSTLPGEIEKLTDHIKLIAEIKRDNKDAKAAKETQVYPALGFLNDLSAFGIYWDNIEQRLYYRTVKNSKTQVHETAVALLPPWGQGLGTKKLRKGDLQTAHLRELFEKIEDRLQTQISDKSKRFEIMLQLLLVKLYDENVHGLAKQEMDFQDFADSPLSDGEVTKLFNKLLEKVKFYGKYLPNKVSASVKLAGAMLRTISSLLAPVSILNCRREVIQDFYMYFAQGVYRWDMAQVFPVRTSWTDGSD